MQRLSERELLTVYYDEILNIMDTIKVGVFITDGAGTVLMVNKESERTSDLKAHEILGRNMQELTAEGYVDESSVLKALETKGEYRLIQNLRDGTSLYLTATPYMQDGEVRLVVCTERDITETKTLEKLLTESKALSEKQAKELEYLRAKSKIKHPELIIKSKNVQKILETIKRVAPLDITILITGESGVGKEVVADYIFQMSQRKDKPFVKINCAAIPESLLESELFGYEKGAFTGADHQGRIGIFEMAQGGTLFLDEIAEIPLRLQAKLLRVLQEKEIRRIGGKKTIAVDVRILAAANVNLEQAVAAGTFREDLYYRLSIVPIEIPPLRERREDICALAEHFVALFCEEYHTRKTISVEAMAELKRAQWPGNIRELRNLMERIVISFDGEQITARQVKNLISSSNKKRKRLQVEEHLSLEELMEEYERELLLSYLEKYATAAEVARRLHVDKSTIGRKLKKYHLLLK